MSTRTTTRLVAPPTAPLPAPDAYRRGLSTVVLAIGALCVVLSLGWREEAPQAVQTVAPQIVFIVATPSPLPPTVVLPTPQPQIVYATVEVPVYIEVQAAPVVEVAPTIYAPPTSEPQIVGEVISWEGETTQITP